MLPATTFISGCVEEIFNNGTSFLRQYGGFSSNGFPMGAHIDSLNECFYGANGEKYMSNAFAMHQESDLTPLLLSLMFFGGMFLANSHSNRNRRAFD